MIAQMIEPIMYFGIGFLLAALSVLVVTPLVHGRAVRLTMRRLEATIPLSMAEVQADKDLQRAEFAMSTRRLETTIEQLRTKSAGQLAELGRKGDAVNRLKIELGTVRHQLSASEDEFMVKTRAALDAQRSSSERQLAEVKSELAKRSSIANVQKGEILALKAQVGVLSDRFAADGKKFETEVGVVPHVPTVPMDSSHSPPLIDRHHEVDAIPLVSTTAPTDSPQRPPLIDQCHGGDIVPLMPTAPVDFQKSPPLIDRHHEVDAIPLVSTGPTDSQQRPPLIDQSHGGDIVPHMTTAPVDFQQSPPVTDRHHEGNGVPLIPTVPKDSLQTRNDRRRERDVFDSVVKNRSMAETPTAPTNSSQNPKNNQRREQDVFDSVLKNRSMAEMPTAPTNSSQNPENNRRREGNVFHVAPKDWPTTAGNSSPPPKHQRHEGDVPSFAPKESPIPEVRPGGQARSDARHHNSDHRIGTVREGSDFSAEPSIRVAPRGSGFKNQFPRTSSIGRRTLRALAACFIAALIGVAASSAWLSHADKIMAMFRNWAPSLVSLASIATKPTPAPAPAVAATSSELAHQLEAMPGDLAVVRRGLEQLAEKQEEMARDIAALRPFQHDIKKQASSAHLQSRTKLTPWPETRPTTIAGWTLRGVTNGTAILEGPNGTWRAMQGDTVPGVGRVESMVRWGNRLIVATSGGLISTP